jgi:hypothetical protein
MSKSLGTLIALTACLYAGLCSAQLLSVDINKTEAPRPDDTAPGFVGWYDVGTGQTATHIFTNFTSTLTPPGFIGSKTQFYRAISVQ